MNEARVESCSEMSLRVGEPLLGSAPRVTAWILMEYRYLWEERALENNTLDVEVRHWLDSELCSLRKAGELPRLQFIRSVNKTSDGGPLSLFVCHDGLLGRLRFEHYGDLLGRRLNSHDLESIEENHYFVCTNGTRDLCCARLGVPTWNELQNRVGDRAWQTSHLGGHRMAPNVLTLPAGYLCGRVYRAEVGAFVKATEEGLLPLRWLRGRSSYPSDAQTCEAMLGEPTCGFKSSSDGRVEFSTHQRLTKRVEIPPRESIRVRPNCRSLEMEEREIFVTGIE